MCVYILPLSGIPLSTYMHAFIYILVCVCIRSDINVRNLLEVNVYTQRRDMVRFYI